MNSSVRFCYWCSFQDRRKLWQATFLYCCLMLCDGFFVANADSGKDSFEDKAMTIAIEGKLLIDPFVPGHRIDVHVEQGIATISGYVQALRAKIRAVKIAKTIKGVVGVVNLVKVKRGTLTDQELHQEVIRVLDEDPATDSFDIVVEVNEGQASLFGEVSSWAAKLLTRSVASGAIGITEVIDELTIVKEPSRSDEDIAVEIRARLEMNVWVFDPPIGIKVDNGKVTLHGRVRSAAESDHVYQNAWVSGVTSVIADDLKIRWEAIRGIHRTEKPVNKTDEEIASALQLAFHYDPRVASFKPQVSVKSGMVTLTGTVDNVKAKKAVEQDAKHTVGVQRVKNLLKVRPGLEINDPELKEKILVALRREPRLTPSQVIVSVRDGNVWLHGRVESIYEKVVAADISARIRGAVDVKNRLKIDAEWTWNPDWVIFKNIQNELWWSPFIDSDILTVSVKDGIATLRGTVHSWAELGIVIENAFEGGAKGVRNHLMVGNQPSEGSELLPDFIYDLPFFSYPDGDILP